MIKRFSSSHGKEFSFRSISITLLAISLLSVSWCQELDLLKCSPKGSVCERVECAPLVSCDNGFIYEKGSRCGCCSVCVEFIDEGVKCSTEKPPEDGPVHSRHCKPGMVCSGGVCKRDDSLLTKCLIKRKNREIGKERFPDALPPEPQMWLPKCDADGNFEIKQCQHGRCFCVDRVTGERIFGQEETELAQNMTCACSHALHKRKKELEGKDRHAEWNTYEHEHCTTSGDYEDLQCFKDTCFCVHPQTGVPYGTMVKNKQRELLPCYVSKLHQESYLKRCEKQLITERRILYDFAQKKIQIRGLLEIDCDLDGSFVRNLCKPEICYCSDRDGTSFGVYKKDRLDGKVDSVMNCRCARDEEDIIHHHARYEKLKCDQYGNFAGFQCYDKECFCVDESGDRITQVVNVENAGIKDIKKECANVLALLGS